MDITVTIKLFATLGKFMPPAADSYPIAPGTTVKQLLAAIEVPQEKAKLIFVNGSRSDINTVLDNGDRVGIFPPVGGG